MHKTLSLLKCAIKSAQGDLRQTISAIKNSNINISTKIVSTFDAEMEIPYFLLQNRVEDSQKSIYKELKDIVSKIVVDLDKDDREKTALLVGTSLVDMNIVDVVNDSVYEYKRTPYYSSKKSIDSYAKDLVDEFGLNGFSMSVSTACTSSVNALLEASNLIQSGAFKYVVVLGVDIFSEMMSNGFSSMKLLSLGVQKPFDISRDGLVLGEAIAGILVGTESSSWVLKGGYSNCNSANITSVSASGEEYADVMQKAMHISNTNIGDITALKAHATSTPTNDMSEINAIKQLFDKDFRFTAIKPYIGHTLGACGILELAIFMSCVDDGFIPKTINHQDSIIDKYTPISEHLECKDGTFMLNYFGFGGNNTSIIIKKELV